MSIPDNYDLWLAHESKQERELNERPECDYCDHRIQEEYYFVINGDVICVSCLKENFMQWIK